MHEHTKGHPFPHLQKVSFPTVGLVPNVSWIRGKTIHDLFSLLSRTGHLPVLSCVTQVRVGPPGEPE